VIATTSFSAWSSEGSHGAELGRTSSSATAQCRQRSTNGRGQAALRGVVKTVVVGGDEGSRAKRHANNRAVTAAVHANGLALLCGVSRGRSLHSFGVELTGRESNDDHKRP
jgi:hypothetical protein